MPTFTFRYDFSKVGSYYQNTQKQGTIDLMTKVTTLYNSEHQPINYLLINADKTETTVAYNKIQEFEEFFELVGDYAGRLCSFQYFEWTRLCPKKLVQKCG